MLQLLDFKNEVLAVAGSGLNTKVAMYLQVAEQFALSYRPFWFMVGNTTLTLVASQATYVLDRRVDGKRISKMSNETSDGHICLDTLANQLWSDPTPTESGTPYSFSFQGISHVAAQPTSASVLALASDSALDVGKKVIVRGKVGNVYTVEEKALDGTDSTTPVSTTNAWTEVETIQKESVFTGSLTATSNAGAVTVVALAPTELSMEAPLVRFLHVPSAADTVRYYFYKKVDRLTNDYDTPLTPEQFQWPVLMTGVLALASYAKKDYSQAQMWESKQDKAIRAMSEWADSLGHVKRKYAPNQRITSLRFDYDALDSYGTP